MSAVDQFACLSGIDDDLILDAIPAAWLGATPPKRNRLAAAYDRFMSSGIAAAVLSVVVALGVLTGIVMLTRHDLPDDPPAGGVTDIEVTSDRETEPSSESAPSAETAEPSDAPADIWIVKDGNADFVMETTADGGNSDPVFMAADKIFEATGAWVSLVDASVPVQGAHYLTFHRDTTTFPYDSEGYRISSDGYSIQIYANNMPGYRAAMDRLIADATTEGGLKLPANYHVEHIPAADPPPDYGGLTFDEYMRALGDKHLYEEFPALRDMDPSCLYYRAYGMSDGRYYLTYNYRLHGLPTVESYRIVVQKEGNAYVYVEKHGPEQMISETYGHLVTKERIQEICAELEELYGIDPYRAGLQLRIEDGKLILSGEIIVSITPPEGMENGGINHEHVLLHVEVYP